MGISGNTTRDAKERLSQILALKPKMVFIALAANDVLKGISPSETKSNLTHIVDTLSKEGVMLVVLGFEGLKGEKSKETLASLSSVDEVMKGNQEIVYVPDAFVGVLDDAKMISKDGMHPNAAGYKKLAQNVHDKAFGALEVLLGYAIKQ
jgi:acyl-CoA thioesterase-1